MAMTLTELRVKFNLSQAELSQKVKMSQGFISNIENGQAISLRSAEKLCTFFEISLDELKVEILPRRIGYRRNHNDRTA